MDEIWSFVYAKNDNVKNAKRAPATAGDVWTWTAICAETKSFGAFLWSVFAGWDAVSGYRERDIIGDMIAAI
jgi:hypothetical protein